MLIIAVVSTTGDYLPPPIACEICPPPPNHGDECSPTEYINGLTCPYYWYVDHGCNYISCDLQKTCTCNENGDGKWDCMYEAPYIAAEGGCYDRAIVGEDQDRRLGTVGTPCDPYIIYDAP
jgi:hypothetical protein